MGYRGGNDFSALLQAAAIWALASTRWVVILHFIPTPAPAPHALPSLLTIQETPRGQFRSKEGEKRLGEATVLVSLEGRTGKLQSEREQLRGE